MKICVKNINVKFLIQLNYKIITSTENGNNVI